MYDDAWMRKLYFAVLKIAINIEGSPSFFWLTDLFLSFRIQLMYMLGFLRMSKGCLLDKVPNINTLLKKDQKYFHPVAPSLF